MKIAFGFRHAPDDRDLKFLLRAAAPLKPIPKRKTWRIWWKGNQGSTPQCVGYAWHALLRSLPRVQRDPDPRTIYVLAQHKDEWQGEDYEGTSVRGGAKALQAVGKISSYGWALNVEEVEQWLGTQGPVVVGVKWYTSMMTPDTHGIIVPKGRLVGGHAVMIAGYDQTKELLRIQNSWGDDWGINGGAWISYMHLDQLIKDGGEACSPTE